MPRFKPSLMIFLGALLGFGLVELLLRTAVPGPAPRLEAEDGLHRYARSDPQTLIFGSSHARSFGPLPALLDQRAPGAGARTVVVPVEWGTMSAYEWLLRERLRPLMAPRQGLQRVLFITEFYDLCHNDESVATLPARLWDLRHFLADVAERGLNDYNRNFLQTHFVRLFPQVALVQDRGLPRILTDLKARARPPGAAQRARAQEEKIAERLQGMERHYPVCWNPIEKRAFEAVLQELLARRLQVTVLLFPKLREVVAPGSDGPARFGAYVRGVCAPLGVPVLDWTHSTPLTIEDFDPDLEHVSPAGNRKLMGWALDHDLAPLLAGGPR